MIRLAIILLIFPSVLFWPRAFYKYEGDQTFQSIIQSQYKTPVRAVCSYNPDTSLNGIKINNAESAKRYIEGKKFCFGETYCLLTNGHRQTIRLTIHPGNSRHNVSEFEVFWSRKTSIEWESEEFETAKTEKGIHLGMNMEEVIAIIGDCYNTTKNQFGNDVLVYRIVSPKDTESRILARHNMPVYYSEYEFGNNKLVRFKFGFECP